MGCVTFIGGELLDRGGVRIPGERGVSLLALAVQHGIPLPCDCERGNCGACAVKVAPRRDRVERTRLSGKEKYTLLATGKITQNQYQAEALPDHPPLWRLACEYRIADEDIVVAF